jgi:two-component system, NtrC family, sensor kinase
VKTSEPSPSGQERSKTSRRSVSERLMASFLVVMLAFVITVGWSLSALRAAARDAALVRTAYFPLVSALGETLMSQNLMNVQLNHVTVARNVDDVQRWITAARRVRPLTFRKIREENRALAKGSPLRRHVFTEIVQIERLVDEGGGAFRELFNVLSRNDLAQAQRLRDRLLALETKAAKRIRVLRRRVQREADDLTAAAEARERRSWALLVGLSVITLFVGLLTSVYARRVLQPLTEVTQRARAVAAGDLRPQAQVLTDDEIGELAATFEDMVAAIRKARQDVVQSERLATVGKMAAHITHEVRNPLSSIGLNLELLEEELDGGKVGDEAVDLLRAIQSEVERLAAISEQYLVAAREPRLQLQEECLNEVARDCYAFMLPELAKSKIDARLSVAEGQRLGVQVDENQLRQALVNLVRNSLEALPDGGRIEVRVARESGQAVLEVIDNGPGVPAEIADTIFDAFYTTKPHGTGLGLALTKAIVEGHGGSIRCVSTQTPGTRFLICLPLADSESVSAVNAANG